MKNKYDFSAGEVDTSSMMRRTAYHSINYSLLTVSLLVIFLGFTPYRLSAQGPGAGWSYYRVVSLSPATTLTNQQVKVTLAAGQYTNMKIDGSDLRFYDEANNNCDYWIESWNNTGTSTIWVKVPTTGSDALVLYYGNAGATAVSNGSTTFDFFDDFTSPLGSNWTKITSGGSVTQSGSAVTLSNTNGGTVSLSNTNAFTPSSSSFLLETKHYEVGYNRNRFYATTASGGSSPIAVGDYGYFSTSGTAQTSGQVFWGSFPGSTSVSNNTNYLTQWRITDGSTYNWYTYNYSTGAAVTNGSRTTTYGSNIRYIAISVTEVASTSTIVDWVRVRQYTATEPTATVGGQNSFTTPTNPITYSGNGYFIVPAGVTSITVECWGAGGRGGNRTSGNNVALAGGGGGAYSRKAISVNPGNVFSLVVGTGSTNTSAGGDTYFGSISTVLAKGGNSVADNSNTSGTGGQASAGIGDVKLNGGNGGIGTGGSFGGGGGSSAGIASNGNYTNTTTNNRNGGTAPTGGGTGGNGAASGVAGIDGSSPGGGGGGGFRAGTSTTQLPGNGANGQVKISWCTPPAAPTVVSPVTYCLNATAVPLTATGSNLLWYTTSNVRTGSSTSHKPTTTTIGTTSYYVSQTVGCEGPRAQIDVVVYAPSTSVLGQTNVSCNGGNDGTITIQAAGGIAPYQFSIDNGSTYSPGTNPYTVNGLNASTIYSIRVKDNTGCESPAIP